MIPNIELPQTEYIVRDELPKVLIYIDGACSPNPGKGGYGIVLIHEATQHRKEVSEPIAGETTNNRAELTAAIEALRLLRKPCWIVLFSDSQWVINGATGKWRVTENSDLWDDLRELARPHLIEWVWVKGHNGDPGNERANDLANVGRLR